MGLNKSSFRPREEVFAELKKIYGDRYDLSTVRFERASAMITINCPIHGDFSKYMQGHRNGVGCQKCGFRIKYDRAVANRGRVFKERARKIHGDKYSYESAVYRGANKRIIITCKVHGPFEVLATHHVSDIVKRGCPYCSRYLTCDTDFKERIAKIHGDTITINHVIDMRKRVTATCHKCGRVWNPWPKVLLEGHGCPICNRSEKAGFDMYKPATLYLIKFLVRKGVEVFKIGITNRTPKQRVWGMGLKRGVTYEILEIQKFGQGVDAYDEEQRLLEIMLGHTYTGEPFTTNGKNELFVIDPRIITQCFIPEL